MNAGANSPRVVAKDLPTTPKRHRLLRADHEASGSNPNALLVELPRHRHFQKVYQFTRRTRHYGSISVAIRPCRLGLRCGRKPHFSVRLRHSRADRSVNAARPRGTYSYSAFSRPTSGFPTVRPE